jgi:DNA-directed RNA polymerase subunit RPC12/RpoP
MKESCSKCGAHLESPWSFCPHCGTSSAHEKAAPAEHEPAPMKRAFGGLLFGVIVAPVCIIVGTMLCLTGLGAVLGIPMIIAGALSPLLGPMFGLDTHAGECPWCGAKVSIVPMVDAFHCQECHQKISVKNHHDMVRAA